MNRGGIETWLMHVLRNIDRTRFQMDFMVHTAQTGAYDREIVSLGSKLFRSPHPAHLWSYSKNLREIVSRHGPYKVVHSHEPIFSGHVLRTAQQEGVPIRIAHIHNDVRKSLPKGFLHKIYLSKTLPWIERYATTGLACSKTAAESMFGKNWEKDPRWRVLFCCLDFAPFSSQVDLLAVRRDFDIPEDSFVIGHVGSFTRQKNHHFFLKVAADAVKLKPNTHILLIGDGLLRREMQKQTNELGLKDKVIFAGLRRDVPRLMLGAMDVFLFPSLFEGLGLVLLEAQAAGLPCVYSDVVPEEVDLVKPLLHRMSLSESPFAWAGTILELGKIKEGLSQYEALSMVKNSVFNIRNGLRKLEEIYSS